MIEPNAASPRFLIRPARQSDRDPILAFCQNTWEWGDYLKYVWDEWLDSTEGRLLVGELEGRPIAVGRVRIVAPGEGWLEGLRVNPEVRQSGVGQAMTQRALEIGVELGASVVRFATRSDAFPVHRIASRLGFRRTASYRVLAALALSDGGPRLRKLESGDARRALALLQEAAGRSEGMIAWRGWHCRTLDLADVERRLAAGLVYSLPASDPASEIESLAFADLEPGLAELNVELVAARHDGQLCELGLALRRLAADLNLEPLEAKMPDEATPDGALLAAGFGNAEMSVPFFIFEWRATG